MTRTATAAAIYALVMISILGALFAVFGQMRFQDYTRYHAVFEDVSGLTEGQFVRVAGVEVGRVTAVEFTDGNRIAVTLDVEDIYTPTRATHATVRYLNLVGDRYLELADGPGEATPLGGSDTTPLGGGGMIDVDRTSPALDLDVLIGSFEPLFRALDPEQVDQLSADLISVLQGQGGTVESILQRTASLTTTIADRDRLVGDVVANLNSVLATMAEHRDEFAVSLDRAQQLADRLAQDGALVAESVARIDASSASLAQLLAASREPLSGSIVEAGNLAAQLDSRSDTIESLATRLPDAYAALTRLGAYGGFFNYYLCGLQIKLSDPSGHSVTSPLFEQTTGRCAPA